MSIQIKLICLYNNKGDTRIIPFKTGNVNIITGKSDTGKSTIISIVEYCFGQSDFRIPDGPIRETVAWYSVIYQAKDFDIFVAKRPPENDGASQSNLFFKVGPELTPPLIDELEENSNDAALVSYFNNVLLISPNLNIPADEHTRPPLEATMKHSRYYLFQKQGTVANQDILFHRQGEPFMPQAIKDTLPYFLGAIPENRLRVIQEYRNAKRNLVLLEKKLQEASAVVNSEMDMARKLYSLAAQNGLIDHNETPTTQEEIFAGLKTAIKWTPSDYNSVNNEVIQKLNDELGEVERNIRYKTDQIYAAESFAREEDGFSREANEQVARLEAINIFKGELENHEYCPLCANKLEAAIPKISMLNRSLSNLRSTLLGVSTERPKLREYIQSLKNERDSLRIEAQRLHDTLSAIYDEHEEASKIRDRNARLGKIVGRIGLYLESIDAIDDLSPLQSEVKNAQDLVAEYEKQLDPQEVQDRISSILNYIGSLMSEWAKTLELEHKGFPYRFDLNKLTVIVDRGGKAVQMSKNMGGGSNWLGCHIITLCALHRYFVEEDRPVPSFLILDQPTQVYFPPEKYEKMEGKKEEVADEDRVAVARLFNFLFDLCTKLSPNFQIIVTEHANLDSARFQEAVVEEPWRGDNALIPMSWILEYLLGKKAHRRIETEDGVVIVEAGEEITEEAIQTAKLAGKISELSKSV